jgi:hypothetical protein
MTNGRSLFSPTDLASVQGYRHTAAHVPHAKGSCTVIRLADLNSRIDRFNQIEMGLLKEELFWKDNALAHP